MPVSMKKASISMLLAEVNRRQRALPKLRRQRANLLAKLAKIEKKITKLGESVGEKRGPGRPPKSGRKVSRKRPRNKVALAEALAAVVKKEPMKIANILTAVKNRGYKSSSNQFRNIVTQRLSADKRFKRVGRGLYAAA